jgi:Ca-activated chloride channel homolog
MSATPSMKTEPFASSSLRPQPGEGPLPHRLPAPASRTHAMPLGALALSALLSIPSAAFGSPSSALREYKSGQYEQALKDYQKLLQRQSDDPRLHFNAGAAAYRNQQLDEAAKQFNQALATPDLNLQQRAYFNRGNTLYWLGENNPDPTKRKESWEKSLKDFESAGKLNQQDADAKYNYEFVKKRLEELKQQQQQNKSDQNKQDQQQQQQNQQNQQNDQQKQDQQQQQQAEQNQSQQQQNQQQQNQQQQNQQQQANQSQDKQQQQQQQAQQQPQSQQQTNQAASESQEKSDEKQDEVAYAHMTPEQAQQLMDAQKGQEKMLQLKPEGKPKDSTRPLKDW